MRYTPAINPVVSQPTSRQVKGPVAAPAIKPIDPHDEAAARTQAHIVQYQERHPEPQLPLVERRIAQRRTQQLPVLVELRSGIERRRRNLLSDGPAEHIDIKA